MSTISWVNDVSGAFATKANWSTGTVPGAGDFADIFNPGLNYFTVSSATKETIASLFLSNYATLDITAGKFAVTVSTSVEGTIIAEAGATLASGGAIANASEIDLASATAGRNSVLLINGSAVSFTGGGVITLAADGEITGAVTTNSLFNNSTIAGGGTLGAGMMTLINQLDGVIDGSAGMRVDTGGNILLNGGLIEATGAGVGLTIGYTQVQNHLGTIAANGGTLALLNATIENGTLATSGGGVIVNSGNGVILDGDGYGLSNSGSVRFQGTLGLEGAITNTGAIYEAGGALAEIELRGNVILLGSGTLAFNTTGVNYIYSAPGASYALTNGGTILGHVTIGNQTINETVIVTNTATGVIDAQGTGGGINLVSNFPVVNAGLIEATGGAVFNIVDGLVDNAGGSIVAGAGSKVELVNVVVDGGAVSIAATGALDAVSAAGGTIDLSGGGSITNAGVISVHGSSVPLVVVGGTVNASGGAFYAAGGAILSLEGVAVHGAGVAADTLNTDAASTIAIDNGSSVQIQGEQDNQGTIALTAGASLTDLRVLAGGASLTSGGTVLMSGAKARILGATSTTVLTNVDNTIKGSGFIGAASLELVNQAAGVIDATGTLTVHTSGPSLANAGLLESSAGGLLALVSTTIDDSAGGTILAAGKVNIQNDTLIGGTLATSGTGLIRLNSGASTIDATTHAVSLTGELQVKGATTLTAAGAVTDSGKLNIYSGKLIVGAAGLTLSGGGQVNLNDSAKNIIIGATTTAVLTNVDTHISGAGQLGGGSMSLVNGGVIVDTQAQALTINTGTHTIQNSGIIEADGKGGVTVTSAVKNTGTLLAVIGTLTLDGAVTGAGVGKVNGGTLFAKSTFTENVAFGTTGVLELANSQGYTGSISGFSKTGTNSLDLRDIAFTKNVTSASYSGTTASGTLTVTDGAHTAHIALIGNYTVSVFTVSSDGHSGTKVVDPSAAGAPLVAAMAAFGARAGGEAGFHARPAARFVPLIARTASA